MLVAIVLGAGIGPYISSLVTNTAVILASECSRYMFKILPVAFRFSTELHPYGRLDVLS